MSFAGIAERVLVVLLSLTIMFGWLRDALANAPSSLGGYHPSLATPSTRLRQRKAPPSTLSSSDDDLSPSKDTSFYHNPFHSSGQMNYVDLPQQQYSNERTYPSYLAEQQTIDDEIRSKLLEREQRATEAQCYAHRKNNYAYRNRTLPVSSVPPEESLSSTDDDEGASALGPYAGIPGYHSSPYSTADDEFDLASVVFWYRNMMQSVKKLL